MHRLMSTGEFVDGEIAYQKAILAAMADTWKHAQGSRRHTSQSSILLEVSDKLIKTPTNLRGMVDNIHQTAMERCKEGTLETWSLWRFYLAALGERLKAGDYQVGNDDTALLCELARGYIRVRDERRIYTSAAQDTKAISFSEVCAACNMEYNAAPGILSSEGADQVSELQSYKSMIRAEVQSPDDLLLYEVPAPNPDQAGSSNAPTPSALAPLPSQSPHMQRSAADLILHCQMSSGRVGSLAEHVHLHGRQARQLQQRLDTLAMVLDPLLTSTDDIIQHLPSLYRLNLFLQDVEALLQDFSGDDWIHKAWRRTHTPEEFLQLHSALDSCVRQLKIEVELTAPIARNELAGAANLDAHDLTAYLRQLQAELDQPHLFGKVSPEEALELRRKLSASYIIAKKLESGLSPSGARTMQFSTRELEMGKLLGRGSYGKVHDGAWLGVPVAIKTLDLRVDDVGVAQDRLIAEARRLSNLQHPHIVQLYGVHVLTGRRRFELVCERMHCSLAQAHIDGVAVLQRCDSPLLAARKAVHVLLQIASALAYLHARNIVLLDLKPGNVMLLSEDSLTMKLSDYGFATARERTSALGRRASSFMAPELRQGQHRDAARANIYSLGAIGDELLGLLSPTVHGDAPHRGVRALQRLLATCQCSEAVGRPPAHIVVHHLQLIRNVLADVADEEGLQVISVEGATLGNTFKPSGVFVGTLTPSDGTATPIPDSARDHTWSNAMFGHACPSSEQGPEEVDDDSAFTMELAKSRNDVVQAKREKKDLKKQVYQLRTQLSQLQDYLRDDEAATQSTFTAEPDTSESDSSEDEEPDTPSYVRPDLDNLNMPVHVVGLDAMQLATAANEAAQHQEGVEGPAPAEQKQGEPVPPNEPLSEAPVTSLPTFDRIVPSPAAGPPRAAPIDPGPRPPTPPSRVPTPPLQPSLPPPEEEAPSFNNSYASNASTAALPTGPNPSYASNASSVAPPAGPSPKGSLASTGSGGPQPLIVPTPRGSMPGQGSGIEGPSRGSFGRGVGASAAADGIVRPSAAIAEPTEGEVPAATGGVPKPPPPPTGRASHQLPPVLNPNGDVEAILAELRRPSPAPDPGNLDAMMLMEAFTTLQRQNSRLQAQILGMEDVSDRLQHLEELNRKLAKDNEVLALRGRERSGNTSQSMYVEVRAEADRLRKELASSRDENEELTGDNIKLLNYLEKLNVNSVR